MTANQRKHESFETDRSTVSAPSVQAAAGTSEESGKVDEVTAIAQAPPGKPDGEVDTRG